MFPNLLDFYLYIRKCFRIYKFASLPPNILGNLSEFVLTVRIVKTSTLIAGKCNGPGGVITQENQNSPATYIES